MAAANAHIRKESDLAVGKLEGMLRRGKRKLYLASKDKIAEQIRNDLRIYLESKQKESAERESKFGRLAQMLREDKDPISLASSAARQKLLDTINRVGDRMQGKSQASADGGKISAEWERSREAEQMVKQQLLKIGIVDPSQLDASLDRNAEGDRELQDLVARTPLLAAEKELRTCLLNTLKELATGKARYYRLQKFMRQDANVGTMEDRMRLLEQEPSILGRKLTLSLGGASPVDTFVAHRGDGFLVLRKGNTKEYYILDLQTHDVTYRDSARIYHDYPLKESSFSLT